MKRFFKILLIILVICIAVFFLYCNNTWLADKQTRSYYNSLKDSLRSRGFSPRLLVVSTKRFRWHNAIQVKLSKAATKSRHMEGDAIDFIVFDVNRDGDCNEKDVDIVYSILDKEIISGKGGLGTYKQAGSFFYRQMVHIDNRGHRARWYQ